MFIFEREREHKPGRDRERDRQTDRQTDRILNRLQALSCQHRA